MRRGFDLALGMALTGLAVWTLYRVLQLATTMEIGPDGGYSVVRCGRFATARSSPDFYWWTTPGSSIPELSSAPFRRRPCRPRGAGGDSAACDADPASGRDAALCDASLPTLALGATVFLAFVPIFEGLVLMLEPALNLFGSLALWLALGSASGKTTAIGAPGLWRCRGPPTLVLDQTAGALFVLLAVALPSLASGRLRLRRRCSARRARR